MSNNGRDHPRSAKLGASIIGLLIVACIGALIYLIPERSTSKENTANPKFKEACYAEHCVTRKLSPENAYTQKEEKAHIQPKQVTVRTCANTRDGVDEAFLVHMLKKDLRNPKSFEKISTNTITLDDQYLIELKFRAENGFGGMSVGRAFLTIDKSTCKPIDYFME